MLTYIFDQSLTLGVLPADWKLANITPIFKKGDRHLPENYRPVSLTKESRKEVVLPFLRSPNVIDANKDFVDPVLVAFVTN